MEKATLQKTQRSNDEVESSNSKIAFPTLNLKLGQLQDTVNTWGAFTQNTYGAYQIELMMKLRFYNS